MLAELTFAHGQTHHSARNLAVFRRRRASLELHARGGGAVCYTRRREPTNEGARRARRRNSLLERRPSAATDEARSGAAGPNFRGPQRYRPGNRIRSRRRRPYAYGKRTAGVCDPLADTTFEPFQRATPRRRYQHPRKSILDRLRSRRRRSRCPVWRRKLARAAFRETSRGG